MTRGEGIFTTKGAKTIKNENQEEDSMESLLFCSFRVFRGKNLLAGKFPFHGKVLLSSLRRRSHSP